jgi:type II secretory ATPase GspE/PulE/Tfp pilus assembly ATPase PilB-like protein
MASKAPSQPQPHTVSTKPLEQVFFQRFAESVSFVDTIIHESINLSASDILFEPQKEELIVRARIDGVLYELGRIGLEAYTRIASRIKVMAKLDPAEKRKIQEGQFTIDHQGRTVNLRIYLS